MSETTLTFQFKVNGNPVDVTSAILRDATGTYGVKRLDTDGIIVAAGTPMVHVGSGTYTYGPFADPAPGLEYVWVVEFVYGGTTQHPQFVTAGGVDSDAYSSPSQGDTYFATRLFATPWARASTEQKTQALTQATTTINKFNFVGRKTDPIQLNEWPRRYVVMNGVLLDSVAVPNDILIAQYEIAIAFLRGHDPEKEIRDLRLTSRGISGVRATYDSTHIPDHTLNGVPSKIAWDYLSPYFNRDRAGNIAIRRVS